MSGAALIGIDWGSTNLRAYRFDADGNVIATRESASGILNVANRGFDAVLEETCSEWIGASLRPAILMSGMVGSRQGWVEAPYVECPASVSDIAGKLTRIDTQLGPAWIVPGLSVRRESGVYDVMRGEETQVLGAIDYTLDYTLDSIGAGTCIAPGTHSKWIDVDRGSIRNLRTFMTGELYSVLRSNSLLGRTMTGTEHHSAEFDRGVQIGLQGDLMGDLFGVRTEALFDRIAPPALASYLSGLLIGAEIFSALQSRMRLRQEAAIRILGTAAISDLYRLALARAGIHQVELVDAHRATARGLWLIAANRTLIDGSPDSRDSP